MVTVRFQVDPCMESKVKEIDFESNFLRELGFVSHHSIHHMATIKVICSNFGVTLPKNYGVAPSTQNAYDLYLMSSKIKK